MEPQRKRQRPVFPGGLKMPADRSWQELTPKVETGTPEIQADGRDRGPCLYLGPNGQRCNRPATEGGFCAVHGPHPHQAIATNRTRVLAAVVAIIGILWPYVDDLVREIIRWMHSR
jgi:hypothetical protein